MKISMKQLRSLVKEALSTDSPDIQSYYRVWYDRFEQLRIILSDCVHERANIDTKDRVFRITNKMIDELKAFQRDIKGYEEKYPRLGR